MHELKFATIHEVGDQSVFQRMRQRSTDMATTAWCGMLGAPVRTLVACSFSAPECAEFRSCTLHVTSWRSPPSDFLTTRRDISFPHKSWPSVRTAGVKVVAACFPVAATCYVLGTASLALMQTSIFTQYALLLIILDIKRIGPHFNSHTLPDNQSRRIFTAEGLYNSMSMIGSDYPTFTSSTSTFQVETQDYDDSHDPQGPTVQRAEMRPELRRRVVLLSAERKKLDLNWIEESESQWIGPTIAV
ncbi:uncharacterized protein LACBIDRAFT_333633 [Laccaria bicolor S238N-H82]|uniref:Predicted protein n=1 Tax=Laccaria bicolor (strain S238N-H82 / ATCC MYA-4686) TaxID=486041 RepID=B0DWK8_LACBS|nr:uncharacterized protein LACBIDRAFT_333633 [Laccaria bicolor S238N-H82]EDR01107.1 predicted protein [Laccaria bicolor S238N-H82]|eukprot:XP_001888326.1 predicted protein [Laccaria bicolor S238N-H82]